jgi:hypothetical protein
MSTEQFLTMLIMPVGGLMIGFLMLFITRKDGVDADKTQKHVH